MNEVTRTMVFLGAAALSLAAAGGAYYATRPVELAGFDRVGEPFYPEFDPNDAKSLNVVSYDPDTATIKEFQVEFKDKFWRIPTHHDYPADAEDRLADTAASVVDIQRGALVSRRESDHERYDVVDPLDEEKTTLKGRGQRITLKREDGTTLADYIIGKKVEERENHYYVRVPSESDVYIADVEIDLSTKFADWIEADLLKLNQSDVTEVIVNKYNIDQQAMRISDREVNRLTRPTFSDPWKLEGLNEATEQVNTEVVSEMLRNLDNLKIVGVRPKPEGLKPDLTVTEEIEQNPLLHRALVADMMSKGFILAEDQDGNPRLVSNRGELEVATKNGVVYSLHFGEIFTGDEHEIEVGFAKDGEKKEGDAAKKDEAAADAAKGEGEETPAADAADEATDEGVADEKTDDAKKPASKRSRYLFVSTRFDEKFAGEKPVEPTKPEQPAAGSEQPAAAEGEQPAAETPAEGEGTEAAATEEKPAAAPAEEKPTEGEEAKPAEPSEHDKALEQYNKDLEKYKNDLKLYEERVEAGKKAAKELNDRFQDWYYAISAESFENLRLSRADLVKPKDEKKEGEGAGDPAAAPTIPETSPEPPADQSAPAETPATPEGEQPAAETPSTEEPAVAPGEPPSESPAEPAADPFNAGEQPPASENPSPPAGETPSPPAEGQQP